MTRAQLLSYMGLVLVGITATVALLAESRLAVSQDIHFLLQLLWLGVAMGGLFVATLQPIIRQHLPLEFPAPVEVDDLPEWRDADRLWMQQHPDSLYLTDDIDKEEA